MEAARKGNQVAHTPALRPASGRRKSRGSLWDIIQSNKRVPLFVRPICWTNMHARVLRISFTKLAPCTAPKPNPEPGSAPSNGHMRPSHTITTLNANLTDILQPAPHANIRGSIETILSTLWPKSFKHTQHEPKLNVYFGDMVYRDAVSAQLLWNCPSVGGTSSFTRTSTRSAEPRILTAPGAAAHAFEGKPIMCYIARNQIVSLRKNIFRVVPHPIWPSNDPVNRLQRLLIKRLLPSNPDEDVYIAGILLGMAQRHFYGTVSPHCRDTPSQLLRLQFHDLELRLLTHDPEAAEFIVYTGHLTGKFLARFHNPRETVYDDSESIAGLQIGYTRVPIWPLLGLRERLGIALGGDLVGKFDPNEMKTWEDNVTDAERPSGNCSKRKRRPTSTAVFNPFNPAGSDDGQCAAKRAKR